MSCEWGREQTQAEALRDFILAANSEKGGGRTGGMKERRLATQEEGERRGGSGAKRRNEKGRVKTDTRTMRREVMMTARRKGRMWRWKRREDRR